MKDAKYMQETAVSVLNRKEQLKEAYEVTQAILSSIEYRAGHGHTLHILSGNFFSPRGGEDTKQKSLSYLQSLGFKVSEHFGNIFIGWGAE